VTARVDEILGAALNGYEDVIRRWCDVQRALSRALAFEPARSILTASADLTRDVAAVQLSGARWLLDS
jgi:hypothetical protein